MLEVLQFIFSSFWIWLGTMLLIVSMSTGIVRVLLALAGLLWKGK